MQCKEEEDAFMSCFKYYKSKKKPPDLSNVIDFSEESDARIKLTMPLLEQRSNVPVGLAAPYNWRCFELSAHPGILVVRNAFSSQAQRYWMARCLKDYPRLPNQVNFAVDDWWCELQQCSHPQEYKRLKNALRWTTFGYQHDWNTKMYSELQRSSFPADLGKLCAYFAQALGFKEFRAEAAIVNYYPMGTTLSPHTDHSEKDLTAPLFSFSFGQTGIFLVGTSSKSVPPAAMFLNSGDLVVMSKESRLSYHAMPRIIKTSHECWNLFEEDMHVDEIEHKRAKKLQDCCMDADLYCKVGEESYWQPFRQYFEDVRVNINVRQVLRPGQMSLYD